MEIAKIISSPYIPSLGIPIIFMVAGVLGKKIARGKGWEIKDFFLGIELMLSSISLALTNIFQQAEKLVNPSLMATSLASKDNNYANGFLVSGCFIAVTFFLFLVVLVIHQELESSSSTQQFFWLVGFSNFLGLALMFSCVYLTNQL